MSGDRTSDNEGMVGASAFKQLLVLFMDGLLYAGVWALVLFLVEGRVFPEGAVTEAGQMAVSTTFIAFYTVQLFALQNRTLAMVLLGVRVVSSRSSTSAPVVFLSTLVRGVLYVYVMVIGFWLILIAALRSKVPVYDPVFGFRMVIAKRS